MLVPLAPHILGRDPPICQHESEYMPIPLGPASIQGQAPLNDWARGPIQNQTPFQAAEYALGSSADQAIPFASPTTG